jgi:hypothetical protein
MLETRHSAVNASCDFGYEPDVPCVVMIWRGYSPGDAFRQANEAILSLIAERGATKLLGDIEALGEISRADQDWLRTDWLPRAAEAGLASAALFTPAFELHHWPVRLVGEQRPQTLALEYFDDGDAGRSWLRSR